MGKFLCVLLTHGFVWRIKIQSTCRPPPILRKSVSATVKAEPSGPIKIFSVAATSGWISFVIRGWICADTSLALSSLSQVYHLWHRQDWHHWGLTPLATGDQPAQSRRLGSNSIWLLSFSLTLRLTSLVQSLMGPSENYFFVWIFMMPDALVRLEYDKYLYGCNKCSNTFSFRVQ